MDVVKPLHASDVDSLLAVKLRNWFGMNFTLSLLCLITRVLKLLRV